MYRANKNFLKTRSFFRLLHCFSLWNGGCVLEDHWTCISKAEDFQEGRKESSSHLWINHFPVSSILIYFLLLLLSCLLLLLPASFVNVCLHGCVCRLILHFWLHLLSTLAAASRRWWLKMEESDALLSPLTGHIKAILFFRRLLTSEVEKRRK